MPFSAWFAVRVPAAMRRDIALKARTPPGPARCLVGGDARSGGLSRSACGACTCENLERRSCRRLVAETAETIFAGLTRAAWSILFSSPAPLIAPKFAPERHFGAKSPISPLKRRSPDLDNHGKDCGFPGLAISDLRPGEVEERPPCGGPRSRSRGACALRVGMVGHEWIYGHVWKNRGARLLRGEGSVPEQRPCGRFVAEPRGDGFRVGDPRSTRPVAGQRNRQPKPAPRGHSRCKPGSTAGARQPGSTANPATLRSSRLNSTPIRWIG